MASIDGFEIEAPTASCHANSCKSRSLLDHARHSAPHRLHDPAWCRVGRLRQMRGLVVAHGETPGLPPGAAAAIAGRARSPPLTRSACCVCSARSGGAPMPAQAGTSLSGGTTIQLIVGMPPGGGVDSYARLVQRHLGRFLPGSPGIMVQNMPGAGSLRSVMALVNSPEDVIGTFSSALLTEAISMPERVKVDFRSLASIGNVSEDIRIPPRSNLGAAVERPVGASRSRRTAPARTTPRNLFGGSSRCKGSADSALRRRAGDARDCGG